MKDIGSYIALLKPYKFYTESVLFCKEFINHWDDIVSSIILLCLYGYLCKPGLSCCIPILLPHSLISPSFSFFCHHTTPHHTTPHRDAIAIAHRHRHDCMISVSLSTASCIGIISLQANPIPSHHFARKSPSAITARSYSKQLLASTIQ